VSPSTPLRHSGGDTTTGENNQMKTGSRRAAVLGAAMIAALALAATPAYAHFCSKTGWSDKALEHAAKSNAWLTADEWLEFIDFAVAEGEICQAGADNLAAQVTSQPANTLFMGPGLLAGGTLKNGKGNTPEHFQYLDFETAFGLCAAA
jgi:hypothetical protein